MAGTERRDLRFARIWNPSLLKMNFALYTSKRNAIGRPRTLVRGLDAAGVRLQALRLRIVGSLPQSLKAPPIKSDSLGLKSGVYPHGRVVRICIRGLPATLVAHILQICDHAWPGRVPSQTFLRQRAGDDEVAPREHREKSEVGWRFLRRQAAHRHVQSLANRLSNVPQGHSLFRDGVISSARFIFLQGKPVETGSVEHM
jgi:hypothetical protein